MKDPFSPEADPYPPRAPLSRREVLALAPTAAAVVTGASGCATLRLGCAPRPDDEQSCQHRFCRYFRAPGR